ncbi:MAG: BlaI/MecI/CopY family transcriptional regulator [Bacteroidales bacterium]
MEVKSLTRSEEQIMKILWEIKQGFVNDVLQHFPEPKPAYNTVSTIIRILEKKGFVSYIAHGKSHCYYPIVSRREYTRKYFKSFLGSYFSNSFQSLTSFFAKEEKLSIDELEELKGMIEKQIKEKKEKND